MKTRLRNQDGLTLVELLVTMVIFLLTITAASNVFTGILTQFKQQSKIAETNIEGIIGLQMLKADIEQAGFGLPWNMGGATYNEAVNDGTTPWDDTQFNDSTANPPRPIVFGDGGTIANPPLNGSDVLVTKATSVGIARAAQRWTYITNAGANNNPPMIWTPDTQYENPQIAPTRDNVIAIKPMAGSRERELVSGGGAFFTAFHTSLGSFDNNFEPVAYSYETHLLYGVNDGSGALRMPFNRADYYVRRPAAGMPVQCSSDGGTGILYKATLSHANGQFPIEYPLLDCVREMQIVFGRDTDNDGDSDAFGPLPATLTAEEVRAQLKEVRIYILAQEGQRDIAYTSPATITATDPDVGAVINFDAAAADLRNFRWKVYTIMAKPYSMK
jgi:prepilin-type N-terminal cleavage/methylation domain-containing protein